MFNKLNKIDYDDGTKWNILENKLRESHKQCLILRNVTLCNSLNLFTKLIHKLEQPQNYAHHFDQIIMVK